MYHNEDWSNLPFNERLAKAIDRCSGTEAYNDGNMSETDGPRFYQEHYEDNSNFGYLWNPQRWENKSTAEGFDWTLDPDLWVPIRVSDINNQGSHDEDGEALTLKMAIFGDYKAYYTAAITNSFTRILNIEKKNQNIRDDILEMNGLNPSWTRQNSGKHSMAAMSGPVVSSLDE